MKKFHSIVEAQEYLYGFRRPNDEQISASFRFDRVREFARLLGDPQNKIRVIHIAGTSGKGSTTSIISHLIVGHGKKTGVSISPHMYDLRERFQINNQLLPEEKFLRYVEEIIPAIEEMKKSEFGPVSFFEISMTLAYYIFLREKVDYAIMETGAGGRVDASNIATAPSKIAVITKIGLDHTDLLGKTITSIAGQKADIIHEKNISITVKQRPSAQKVIQERASHMDSMHSTVIAGQNYKSINIKENTLYFDYRYKRLRLDDLALSLNGIFQVENASIALAAVYEAAQRDGFSLIEETIRQVFKHMKSPGRFEEFLIHGKKVIVDGAHNPQKMSAFIRGLRRKYPGETFDFLIAFKHGKDYHQMMKYFIPLANKIFVSRFALSDQVLHTEGEPVEKIVKVIESNFQFTNIEAYEPSRVALDVALRENSKTLVITGSIYFIGELYRELRKLS